jgi:hypothetical protein
LQRLNTKRQSKKAAGFLKTLTEQVQKARLLFKIAGGLLGESRRRNGKIKISFNNEYI